MLAAASRSNRPGPPLLLLLLLLLWVWVCLCSRQDDICGCWPPPDAVSNLTPPPLLLLLLVWLWVGVRVHAADKTISVEDGRKFAAVLPGHRIVEVEGADHNFTGVVYMYIGMLLCLQAVVLCACAGCVCVCVSIDSALCLPRLAGDNTCCVPVLGVCVPADCCNVLAACGAVACRRQRPLAAAAQGCAGLPAA